MEANETIKKYFEVLEKETANCYGVSNKARKEGYDHEEKVDIPLAKGIAERVEGLISAVVPQILKSGVAQRIEKLEKEFGVLDWRIALKIAEEVAKQKFCKFKDTREAIETGIRVGMAYITLGVIAAPLEGFIELKLKKTREGKEYFSCFFAGPIRAAGGTAEAVTIVIADYVRAKLGYEKYDPDEKEIKRGVAEVLDYHERVTNLQYLPSEKEIEFLVKHLPVEVDGDPTERIDVSNYKDLERIETNRIRGGFCLVIAEGIAQKAPKLIKQLDAWGKDFEIDWGFLHKFLEIQKNVKAGKDLISKEEKISPNYIYIKDLVAGRPILAHPLAKGGFRLRYGRTRLSGFSADAINPLTMQVLNKYIAVGTQLKVERPGKATVLTPCDYIEGPILKLNNGGVVKIESEKELKENVDEIKEILFLGDLLINYGDFFENGHKLVPAGYCEEWWIQELEKKIVDLFGSLDLNKLAEMIKIKEEDLSVLIKEPFKTRISARAAFNISKELDIPLHPYYTYFWTNISKEEFLNFMRWVRKANIKKEENRIEKMILPYEEDRKRTLEILGVPHLFVNNEFVVIKDECAEALFRTLSLDKNIDEKGLENASSVLECVNLLSGVKIRDKSGTFIGTRMGRPEKAKMRKLTGSPHMLFPVGGEGGRLRSFQSAIEKGHITADFPLFKCTNCNKETIFSVCELCNKKTKKLYYCNTCGVIEKKCEHEPKTFLNKSIDINHYIKAALKKLKTRNMPELIKGVRGTSNKDHTPEHLIKGILRAKHNIFVNKDGTTRYDMTELPVTHFKPSEIGTSVEKLKELGYEKDINEKPLENEDQILEIFPQDVILPSCSSALDENADEVLFRVANFIDELLVKLYGLEQYYKLKTKKDLVGQLIVGLAPHTSAGTVGRIIGFSKTQGFFTNPMFHAAMRRNCFDYDTRIPIIKDNNIKIVKIGEFVESLNPKKIVDSFGTKEKKVDGLFTLGYNKLTKKVVKVPIYNFTKHRQDLEFIKIKTQSGREITVTKDHKFPIVENNKIFTKRAANIKINNTLLVPSKINVLDNIDDIREYNLIDLFKDEKSLMVRNIKEFVKKILKKSDQSIIKEKLKINSKNIQNYHQRDSYPFQFILELLHQNRFKITKIPKTAKIGIKRDNVTINSRIKVTKNLLEIFGFYIAEGFCRENNSKKGLYQISIASMDKNIQKKIINTFKNSFGINPSEHHKDHVTFSSKLINGFFREKLKLGKNSKEKRFSTLVSLPKEKLSCVLRGYYEGDGSVSKSDLRVICDTVSEELVEDLQIALQRFGIFTRMYKSKRKASGILKSFYEKKKVNPFFKSTKLIIPSDYVKKYSDNIGFLSARKKNILDYILKNKKPKGMKLVKLNNDIILDIVKEITIKKPNTSYCLNVDGNIVLANNIFTYQCDGDEACCILLMDALLNFSRSYLPDKRGSRTMDAPLVLTSILIPSEVDDEVHGMDVAWRYPLELYEAALEYKNPWEIKIQQVKGFLDTEKQYSGFGFTHNVSSMNSGVLCSAYKTLPSMEEKLKGQMELAEKIFAVDESDVARLVIEKHFLRDIRGNLRKFSMQKFRCSKCNEKYRRPPLIGRCLKCGGNIIFTISEGSIVKYLEPSISLAEKYDVPIYLKQTLELTKRRIEDVFGKEKEKQIGLGSWF